MKIRLMRRASCLYFILILCLFCCSGCWDRKELKTQGIVAGEGVDYSAGKYLYTFQVIKPGEVAQPKAKGGGGESTVALCVFHSGCSVGDLPTVLRGGLVFYLADTPSQKRSKR